MAIYRIADLNIKIKPLSSYTENLLEEYKVACDKYDLTQVQLKRKLKNF